MFQLIQTVNILLNTTGSGTVSFPSSVTRGFPPINLYGDLHFYSTGIMDRTLFEFRLEVQQDVTQL